MAEKLTFLAVSSHAEKGGIYNVSMDTETGDMETSLWCALPGANYLLYDAGRKLFFATVNRIGGGEKTGGVARIGKDGKLAGIYSAGGFNTCHLALSPDGKRLYTAQYSDGTMSEYLLAPDGTPGEPKVFRKAGTGVLPRQECPHSHFVGFTPDGKCLFCVDLGLDTVFFYPYREDTGISGEPAEACVPFGEGPRHLVFSPEGTQFFVANELGSTVTNFARGRGEIHEIETLTTLLQEPVIENWPGAIRLSPDGKYLYISNRGDDSISQFVRVRNRMKLLRVTGCGGHWPRDFAFSPDGKFAVTANERSGNLASFRVHPETGGLIPFGRTAAIPNVLNCVMM